MKQIFVKLMSMSAAFALLFAIVPTQAIAADPNSTQQIVEEVDQPLNNDQLTDDTTDEDQQQTGDEQEQTNEDEGNVDQPVGEEGSDQDQGNEEEQPNDEDANEEGSGETEQALTDIDNHWAKEVIEKLVAKKIVLGYEDGTYKPQNDITRAEFITLVNKALELEEKAEIDFSDVTEEDWYFAEVSKAVAAGYIAGYADGTMQPNKPISRQEAAKVMVAAFDTKEEVEKNNENKAEEFTDADKISDWANEYVTEAKAKGYITGFEDGSFAPLDNILRGETAQLLVNVLSMDEEEQNDNGAEEETINKVQLAADIESAQALHDSAVEGSNVGEYAADSKATLLQVIEQAKLIMDSETASQEEVDQAIKALSDAVIAFEAGIVEEQTE